MNQFDKIYLSWRLSKSQARIMVGELTIGVDQNVSFHYTNINQAKHMGFTGYPGLSINKQDHDLVLDLFSKRLINTERSDSNYLLDFWEIDTDLKDNKLYVLAMTQGINSIDNFEFLADFKLVEGLHFVTDIAGLSHSLFNLSKIKRGDRLTFEKENHPKDENAIKIKFKDELVGYIKKGHNMVFQQTHSEDLKIEVKQIINNSEEQKLFVRVYV